LRPAWPGSAGNLPVVRRLSLAALVAAVVVVTAGCGGSGEPDRSALAQELAQLCDTARADMEALGLPAEKGFAVIPPTAKIGQRLAKDVAGLKGTTPHEREQVASLAKYLAFYYGELAAGAKLYRVGQAEAYRITVERATPTLVSAEALATRMGAPECAVRPFPDA
jgi:hypothetical protein